jgi:hypothetical protein
MPLSTTQDSSPYAPAAAQARAPRTLELDEFNYLSVLVSIILGLGITQLLTGVGRLLQNRARVRIYWPTIGWIVLQLLVHIQVWWSMFELRDQVGWTFPGFLSVLLVPVVLYLMSALTLPDFGDAIRDDLREHYYASCRWVYSLGVLLVALTFAREVILEGSIDTDLDTAAKLLFAALFASGVITRRPRAHELLVPTLLVLLLAYIGTLFMDLPGPDD